MPTLTATYSPEDNKLRMYASSRLDADTYQRVRAAGFIWAPKQELFVAPMWTPARADLLIELCGEIGDEDSSLVDRAEARADRFENLSEKRKDEAQAARQTVASIADHIPLGQPILVGHHSERHARKDAERIENGMRKAIGLWDTSKYWKQRAAGALRHAKYKELPGVRHRRIKGLEADKRKQEKTIAEAEKFMAAWQREGLTKERALAIASYIHFSICFKLCDYPRQAPASQYEGEMSIWSALDGGVIDELQARELAVLAHVRTIAWAKRWFDHYENRLAYERAMLDEQGGTPANRFNIEVGGQVLVGREWLVVMRVNKSGETINSVSTNARYCRVKSIEEIADYRAPSAENVAKVKAANKLPPLTNYPGEGFKEVTAAQWKRMSSDYAFTRIVKRTETTGEHRARFIFGAGCTLIQAFITDAKRVDPPALPAKQAEPVTFERELVAAAPRPSCAPAETNEFDALREQLKAGVQVVSAPQLFPTPASLAEKMVQLAGIHRGARILEPSAGTGNIVRAVAQVLDLADTNFHAVEINHALAGKLQSVFPDVNVVCADFLECGPDRFDNFDVILMNPPFANAVDIMHIEHAFGMLKPGGRLVAICANGPRQNQQLRPMVERLGGEWEDLPPDTFKESGTGVRAALILISRPAVDTLRACSTPANNYSATSAS